MYFLLIGIAALVMKYLEFGPVASLPWWAVLSPFGLAVIWWAWADSSGYTKRVEMNLMEKRKQDRLEKQRAQMGMLPKRGKK
jgi:small Trp-rich protein